MQWRGGLPAALGTGSENESWYVSGCPRQRTFGSVLPFHASAGIRPPCKESDRADFPASAIRADHLHHGSGAVKLEESPCRRERPDTGERGFAGLALRRHTRPCCTLHTTRANRTGAAGNPGSCASAAFPFPLAAVPECSARHAPVRSTGGQIRTGVDVREP